MAIINKDRAPKLYCKIIGSNEYKEIGEVRRIDIEESPMRMPTVDVSAATIKSIVYDKGINNVSEFLVSLSEGKIQVELPKHYIINDGATILFWKDGTKTIVKRASDDEFNPRLAFLTAFFQRYCGMSKNKANKYLASLQVEKKPEPKEVKVEEKPKRGRPKKDTYKFKVGDKVIGNKKATDRYCISHEGWIGEVTNVTKNYFNAVGNGAAGKIGFCLDYKCFDKYKEEK